MKTNHTFQQNFFVLLALAIILLTSVKTGAKSVYEQRPVDPEAVYFTPENFAITADGKTDVTSELQKAINQMKDEKNFGIIFIPEGKYLLSKTVYIPKAIRLIGYGKNRPEFILSPKTPGYQTEVTDDKGKANYMFWFTSRVVKENDQSIPDANAGTFYSAFSNIDITIGKGNPAAVALRIHFAQHSFVSHCDIHIGEGKAGVFDVGNFMEDVRFFGGDYGIYTTKTSPGWQFMMLDTWFEGQRKAAIKTQETGLTIVRMQAKNVPHVIEIEPNFWEKLFMEDCRFTDVKNSAIVISNKNNDHNQISLLNVDCLNVPVLAEYRRSETKTNWEGKMYKVKKFVYGLHIDDLGETPIYRTTNEIETLTIFPEMVKTDIPQLPAMSTWANLKDFGAVGDGETDDTKAVQKAIESNHPVYVPQGWYKVSESIKLKPNSILIGLNPISTQFLLADNTPAFSGFGAPNPLLEVPAGGNAIVTGIGLSTGDYNSRAVACKWISGPQSYLNDVKFLGGHGDMSRGPQKPWERKPRDNSREGRILQGMDPAWDTQYWSLWITNNGGGIFSNIWSASTFATNGCYVSNTSTTGKIYAMSVEHHVRNEVRFNNVSNWKVYALQLEEESRESSNCQPLEVENSSNILFSNFYTFRVIRVKTPYPYAVRTWNCKNVEFLNFHNYTQMKYTTTNSIYDINSNTQVRPWEFARLFISGKSPEKETPGKVRELASGFEFAEGICHDSKGNIYFSDGQSRRIYQWSVEKDALKLVADFPLEPQALACDSKDNLLVVFRYNPQPGYLVNGEQERFSNPPDADGTSFSGWGNSGFAIWVYSIDPENPEESIQKLPLVPMGSIKNIQKALYPSNRWRDGHDYNDIVVNPATECFVAPDGKTIFPVCYDFARSNALVEAFPGKPVYSTNEYDKRVVKLDVDNEGYLSNLQYFAEKGEFSTAVDKQGNLYIADGNIYVFNPEGKQINYIEIPERPMTISFGGKEGNTLFMTSAKKLFSLAIY
jgi:hypothetical protein